MANSGKVKSVVVLQSDDDFGGDPAVLHGKAPKPKKKKKKQSAALSPLEKSVMNAAKQYDKATSAYRDAHEKSNSKKKNGWIKDYPKNANKALSKLGAGGMIPGLKLPKLF